MGQCLPRVFVPDAAESKVRDEAPDDVDYHKADGEVAEGRALLSVVPERPEDLAALNSHVDLHRQVHTVRYPLMAWSTWILLSCSGSKASWSLGTVGSTSPVLMIKGLLDIIL